MNETTNQAGMSGRHRIAAVAYRAPSAAGIGVEQRHAAVIAALREHAHVDVMLLGGGGKVPEIMPGQQPLLLGWDTLLQASRAGVLPDGLWLDLDELPSAREESMGDPQSGRRKLFHRMLEQRFLPACKQIVVCSEREKELLLQEIPDVKPGRVAVWPNVVTPKPALHRVTNGPLRLLFIGYLDYFPNRQGVTWLVEKVWPLVRAALPAARLDIVGAGDCGLPRGGGIEFHGHVPDPGTFYARASLALAPLHSGGGTRIKILEAFAYGVAVVSTPFGAGGLDVRHGWHLWMARTADEFAQAILHLLHEPVTRRNLEHNALAWFLENHAPSALARVVGGWLAEIGPEPGSLLDVNPAAT